MEGVSLSEQKGVNLAERYRLLAYSPMSRYSMDPRSKSIECVKDSRPFWLGFRWCSGTRSSIAKKQYFRMLFFLERGLNGALRGASQLSAGARLPQTGFEHVGSLLDQTFASNSLPAFG